MHFISPRSPSCLCVCFKHGLSIIVSNPLVARCVLLSPLFIFFKSIWWRVRRCEGDFHASNFEKKNHGETDWVKVGYCLNKAFLMDARGVRWPRVPVNRRCASVPQPPLVQTHTLTITAASNSLPSGVSTTEVPVVPTKTLVYESSKVGGSARVRVSRRQVCMAEGIVSVEQAGLGDDWDRAPPARAWKDATRRRPLKRFLPSVVLLSQVADDGAEDKESTTVSSSSETTSGTSVTTTTTHISKVRSVAVDILEPALRLRENHELLKISFEGTRTLNTTLKLWNVYCT